MIRTISGPCGPALRAHPRRDHVIKSLAMQGSLREVQPDAFNEPVKILKTSLACENLSWSVRDLILSCNSVWPPICISFNLPEIREPIKIMWFYPCLVGEIIKQPTEAFWYIHWSHLKEVGDHSYPDQAQTQIEVIGCESRLENICCGQ